MKDTRKVIRIVKRKNNEMNVDISLIKKEEESKNGHN